MRITEGRIRQIVRQEARRALDEMAWAGGFPPVRNDEDDRFIPTPSDPRERINKRGAGTFASSPQFAELAKKTFAALPFPVWTAPYLGSTRRWDVSLSIRSAVLPLDPDGMEKLRDVGFQELDGIRPGDCVILYSTSRSVKRTLGTPWMIIHAMLDEEYTSGAGDLSPTWGYLHDDINQQDSNFPDLEPLLEDPAWIKALTMRSAREGLITNLADAFSEIMCQELLTRSGFHFDPERLDPSLIRPMELLKKIVQRAGREFKKNMQGKLIIVFVN